jgi:hypothetical protein
MQKKTVVAYFKVHGGSVNQERLGKTPKNIEIGHVLFTTHYTRDPSKMQIWVM